MTPTRYDPTRQAEIDAEPAQQRRRDPQAAVLRFYDRHDAAIAAAMRATPQKAACRSGCAACCYYKVEARAVEVLAIRDFVAARFTPAQRAALEARVEHNVAEAAHWSHVDHLTRDQRCPLLVDDACSIYPVRPANCRSYHSTDVAACQALSRQPDDLSMRVPYIDAVFETATASVAGFAQAMQHARLDVTLYDLGSALREALRDDGADAPIARILAGEPAFLTAKVIGTPPD